MAGPAPKFQPSESIPTTTKSLRDAARHLGMSVRTLESWSMTGRISPRDDGLWDLETITEEAERSASNRTGSPERQQWECERLKWQAKSERIRYEHLEDSLISVDQVRESRQLQVHHLRESLIPIAKRISVRLVGCDRRGIESLIEDEIRQVVRSFSES